MTRVEATGQKVVVRADKSKTHFFKIARLGFANPSLWNFVSLFGSGRTRANIENSTSIPRKIYQSLPASSIRARTPREKAPAQKYRRFLQFPARRHDLVPVDDLSHVPSKRPPCDETRSSAGGLHHPNGGYGTSIAVEPVRVIRFCQTVGRSDDSL